jgi:hypothetical protein
MPWNITTEPIDLERIRKALSIPATKEWLDIIRTAMSRLERESPSSIATVQEYLDQLEITRTQKRAQRTSDSYAMIRADVVEWQPGTKGAGYDLDEAELVQLIAQTLYIEPPETSNYGALLRS